MTYEPLARKYRPQQFAEVVGQNHITETLRAAIAGGRVAAAYLFAGQRGSGKTTVARIVAKAVNCDAAAGRRALRCVRPLRGDHRGPQPRRPRDRRCFQQQRGRRARAARERRLRGLVAGQAQGVHRGRGAHALRGRLQRALEDARRAAGARAVHLRHHRTPQSARYDSLALPGVRLPAAAHRGDPRAHSQHLRRGEARHRRRGAVPARQARRRQHA